MRFMWSALTASIALASSPALAAPLKVACVGEQTTHSDQLNRTVEYPAMLQTGIGAAYDIQNFGDCCATVLNNYPKQAETHPYILGGGKPSYHESLTYAPDVVIIGSWGKHDTEIATSLTKGVIDPVQFQKDYEALLAAYQSLPSKPKIYLSTPVPIPKGAPTGPTTDVILPAVRAAAVKFQLPIVDLYSVFLNQPQLYKDDTHVTNVEGLQTIADTVKAALLGGDAPDAGAPGDAGDPPADDAAPPPDPVDANVPPLHDAGGAPADTASGGNEAGCSVGATPNRAPFPFSAAATALVLGLAVARARTARTRKRRDTAR